jgi:hypothetical protein
MKTKDIQRLIPILLVSLVTIAAAGCGGGGGSSTQPSSGQAEAPAAQDASSESTGAEGKGHYQGGEKSIEDFGSEAEGASRAALLGAFHSYLNAVATEDNAAACSYLSVNVQRSLERLAGGQGKSPGCAQILSKLLSPTAPAISREQAEGGITKVRVEGDRAFVVFHAPGAKLYQMTMVRESGEWKVATVAASVLVPSAATLGQ